jgi:hypothetical protein
MLTPVGGNLDEPLFIEEDLGAQPRVFGVDARTPAPRRFSCARLCSRLLGWCSSSNDAAEARAATIGRPDVGSSAVRSFFEEMVIYVLSFLWKDLLVSHILQMQPLPYCVNCSAAAAPCHKAPGAPLPCAPPASAGKQALLAVLLLLLSPLAVRGPAANVLSRPTSEGSGTVAGMSVGWVLGDALVQLHIEVVDGALSTSELGARNALNFVLSSASTLAASALILFLERTAERLRLRAALQLPAQALGVMVMVAWAHTASALIMAGLAGHDDGTEGLGPLEDGSTDRGALYNRVLLLWAVCLSSAFALLVTKLVACRSRLAAGLASSVSDAVARGGVSRVSSFSEMVSDARGPSISSNRIGIGGSSITTSFSNRNGNDDEEEMEYEMEYALHEQEMREAPGSRSVAFSQIRSRSPPPEVFTIRTPDSALPLPRFPSPPTSRRTSNAAAAAAIAPSPTPSETGDGWWAGGGADGGGFVFAFPQAPQRLSRRAAARIHRHCLRPLLIQFLAKLEGCTARVTGCAWTDAIVSWTSLGHFPSASVAAEDLAASLLLTCTAAAWMALCGRRSSDAISDAEKEGSREAIEIFFATNAMLFVVGWAWVELMRDLSSLSASALSLALGVGAQSGRSVLACFTTFLFGPAIGIVVACHLRARRVPRR